MPSTRPPAQPAFAGPLRKTPRAILIGDDPALAADGADGPDGASSGHHPGQHPSPAPAPTEFPVVADTVGADRVPPAEDAPAPLPQPAVPAFAGTAGAGQPEPAQAGAGLGVARRAGDPLLSTVLAGRTGNRTIPITRLDPSLHATLRLISGRTGVSIQELVNGAVRTWLHQNQEALVANGVLEA